MAKEKGRQWDGKSRVSNETYRQNWNDGSIVCANPFDLSQPGE